MGGGGAEEACLSVCLSEGWGMRYKAEAGEGEGRYTAGEQRVGGGDFSLPTTKLSF